MREGARAAIGENDGPPRRREMRMQPIESIHCPYCGEPIDLFIDDSVEDQQYVEDCAVCCRPINVAVTVSAEGDVDVRTWAENEA